MTPYLPVLGVSAVTFFITAAYLIANLNAVVSLFARRGPQHGDLQADSRGGRRRASRTAVIVALVLHVAAIVGVVFSVIAATTETVDTAPNRAGLPPEMELVPEK